MGVRDSYLASVKATIYGLYPQAQIVDISHHVAPFDIAQASFILRSVYHEFPKGTIHIIGVNPEKYVPTGLFPITEHTNHLVIEYKGYFFIGADNGIFSLLFDETPDGIYELDFELTPEEQTFPVKSVFARAACFIAAGKHPREFATATTGIRERQLIRPMVEKDAIKGSVIYIDTYGNVITNITRKLFEENRRGRRFLVSFRGNEHELDTLRQNYSEVPEGEMLAFFNSTGHLEIAINKGVEGMGGGASSLVSLKLNDSVRVDFR